MCNSVKSPILLYRTWDDSFHKKFRYVFFKYGDSVHKDKINFTILKYFG